MKKIFFIFISLSFFSINVNAQWVQQNSGSIDNFCSVAFPNSNVGYVGASNGKIYKTVDGGSIWATLPGTPIFSVAPLFFSSVDTGFSAGPGGIIKTVDGGLTWIDNFPYSNIFPTSFSFLSADVGFAICSNSNQDTVYTYKTVNAGASWNLISTFEASGLPNAYFTSQSTGFMVINSYGLYKTIDGGLTWIPKLTSPASWFLNVVHFPSPSVGYAIGGDSLFKSTDSGESWFALNYPPSINLTSAQFSDDNHGFAVGGDGFSQGAIIKTADGGANWTVDISITQTFYSIYFPNAYTGYACGTAGIIYKLDLGIGINDIAKDDELTMYPNPATNEITIESKMQNAEIEIRDVLGQMVYRTKAIAASSTIDVSMLSKGVYFISLQNGKQTINKKFIKQE